MAFVYWIHLPEHTNIFTQGYVGYTNKTVEQRWKGHKKESRAARSLNYPVYNAIRKYGDALIISTVLEGAEDYCSNLEFKLRPEVKIGWNLHVGGNKGFMGSTHSNEAKAKISAKGRGRVFSEAHKNNLSASQVKVILIPKTLTSEPWASPRAIKSLWLNAEKLFDLYRDNEPIGAKRFASISGELGQRARCILERFRNGWIPREDKDWFSFSEKEQELVNV